MRARAVYAAGICAAALALSGLSVGSATASTSSAPTAVAHSTTAVNGTPARVGATPLCGTAEGTWTSDGISSQFFGPSLPQGDTWGAKRVKCSGTTTVGTIVVDGYPTQSSDINFNVKVYKNKTAGSNARFGGAAEPQPNDAKRPICKYTDAPGTYAAAGVSGAQWTIKLPTDCNISRRVGKKGPWFAVQADLDFGTSGQWFWATQTAADQPTEADWADRGGLFSACDTFQSSGSPSVDMLMQDCVFGADNGEPDFIMVLYP